MSEESQVSYSTWHLPIHDYIRVQDPTSTLNEPQVFDCTFNLEFHLNELQRWKFSRIQKCQFSRVQSSGVKRSQEENPIQCQCRMPPLMLANLNIQFDIIQLLEIQLNPIQCQFRMPFFKRPERFKQNIWSQLFMLSQILRQINTMMIIPEVVKL